VGQKTDVNSIEELQENTNVLDVSTNQSWRLDSSWEFVMWQKEEEQRMMENVAKFPIPTPPNSPLDGRRRIKETTAENYSSACSQTEDSLSSTNNNSSTNMNRFSRYDNLEGTKTDDENSSEECRFEGDGQEKISTPWDSSKWEHLLRLVSESTQQLDLLQVDNLSNRNNLNLYEFEQQKTTGDNKANDSKPLSSDPLQRVCRVFLTNFFKAHKQFLNENTSFNFVLDFYNHRC